MKTNMQNDIITSIDIGTTKICVLVGKILKGTQVEIIGYSKTPSEGMRKGVVVDIAKTIYAINAAVKEAEMMIGQPISKALIGISGGHISSMNSRGIVPIKKGNVRFNDIENVLAAAQAVPIPEGQQILHVLPQYFIIDGRDTVYDPLGMHGVRLEVEAHIITGSIASVQNLVGCCQKADVQVDDIILEQIASSDAVLSDDERMLGVGMLDIGGGTADLAIYYQGSIRHTMVLPVAGNHFTNDLAVGLRITRSEAERLKKEYGAVLHQLIEDNALVETESVQGIDHKTIQQHDLVDILRPRAIELLTIIKKEMVTRKLSGYMATGLVITGGGSLLRGMQQLAQEIFKMPVRIGRPHVLFDPPESLQNPIYATGYGMLIHALKKHTRNQWQPHAILTAGRIFERMKSWVTDLF